MRFVLFAYSSTGARVLRTLLEMRREVVGVFTHEDRPGERIWFESVARLASESGIPVHFVSGDNPVAAAPYEDLVRTLRPDVILSATFRAMIPSSVLALASTAALNFHPSLLPRYRGRAPVNWVLVQGEEETGMTLHHMVDRPDAGDIVGQVRLPIGPDETAPELQRRMDEAAAALVRNLTPRIEDGTAPRIPQDSSRSSYFGRRRPEDGRFEWTWPARRIHNLVRAVTRPWPGAFAEEAGGTRLLLWRSRVHPPGACAPLHPGELSRSDLGPGTFAGTGDGLIEILDAEWVPAAAPASRGPT